MAKEEPIGTLALKLKRVSPNTRAKLMQALPAGTRARVRWASQMPKLRAIVRLSKKKRVVFTPTLRTFAQNLQAKYVRNGRKPSYKSNEERDEHEVRLMMNGWKYALTRINAGARPSATSVPVRAQAQTATKRPKVTGGVRALVSGKRRRAQTSAMRSI
jgi:hypothetical protein